jgi:serine/threonine protein kinase
LPGYRIIEKAARLPSILEQWLDMHLSPEFLDLKNLLVSMLRINPAERISAADALNHRFFCAGNPQDLLPCTLPRIAIPECHGRLVRPSVPGSSGILRPARVLAPIVVF